MNEAQMLEHLKKKYPDLEKSPNSTDGYDCLTKKGNLYMELKARRTHYDTLILEEKKYNFLIDMSNKLGMKAVYINWTPSGMWMFNLSSSHNSYKWEEQWLPRNTDFGNKSKTTKMVTLLDVKNGTRLI